MEGGIMVSLCCKLEDEQQQLQLLATLNNIFKGYRDIVILCIGTDRSAGDSLGPMVGTFLKEFLPDANIYGTLACPVHAQNLEEKAKEISIKYPKAFILAVDASLGRLDSVGSIYFKPEPLAPGAGVKKDLPKVGNASITGVVNVGGWLEYMVLQNTRLHTTYQLAKYIAGTIGQALLAKQTIQAVAVTS
jgi:putative sporulation protein YyaC